MRTPNGTITRILALAGLVAAGWLAGMYAGQQAHASAAGAPSQTSSQARADFPADPDAGGPGPTNPNGPAY